MSRQSGLKSRPSTPTSRTATTLRFAVLAWLAVNLSACGFHLRGSVHLPPDMHKTYIDGYGASPLVRALQRELRDAGATVAGAPNDASAIIHVQNLTDQRRVLSVDVNGQVQEYEVSLVVHYSVTRANGTTLAANQRLVAVRDYRFDPTDIIGKAGEDELLRKEMAQDLARTMLRRLEYSSLQGGG